MTNDIQKEIDDRNERLAGIGAPRQHEHNPLEGLTVEVQNELRVNRETRGLPPQLQKGIGQRWEKEGLPEQPEVTPKLTDDEIYDSAHKFDQNPDRVNSIIGGIVEDDTLSAEEKRELVHGVESNSTDLLAGKSARQYLGDISAEKVRQLIDRKVLAPSAVNDRQEWCFSRETMDEAKEFMADETARTARINID